MEDGRPSATAMTAARQRAAHMLWDDAPKIFQDLLALGFSGVENEGALQTTLGAMQAATMWDGSSANELTGRFWDAAIAIDPEAKRHAEARGSYGSAEALSGLLKGAGLTGIEVTDFTMPCQFASFDDYWLPLTKGQGPSGVYLTRLSEDHRAALRERLRQNLFGNRADGPFTLQAKAWAVKGTVP